MVTIKFPEFIMIGSTKFKVTTRKNRGGAEFKFAFKDSKPEIIIGIRELKSNPIRVLKLIIHELQEAILYELGCRFERSDEQSHFVFHYGHQQYTTACSMLAGALSQFLND